MALDRREAKLDAEARRLWPGHRRLVRRRLSTRSAPGYSATLIAIDGHFSD
jgi:hypothetical protein